MFTNYGDKDFFENGCLVDTEHSDTVFPMLLCMPYSDEDGMYQMARVQVDIAEDWIEKERVMSFIGMTEETYDPVQFAIGCTEYYSWENFGADDYLNPCFDWRHMEKKDICGILKYELIASDNLDIVW